MEAFKLFLIRSPPPNNEFGYMYCSDSDSKYSASPNVYTRAAYMNGLGLPPALNSKHQAVTRLLTLVTLFYADNKGQSWLGRNDFTNMTA